VARWEYSGLIERWWPIGDVRTQYRNVLDQRECDGLVGMQSLCEDVVAL
jgi:hypothetical protein